MNTLRLFLAAASLMLLGAFSLSAQSFQWERLAGPEGGFVRSMARLQDGTLFAALDQQGLYRSNDAGSSWTRLSLKTPETWAAMIHATPDGALLLAMPDSTLRRSTDMGATWSLAMTGLYWSTPLVNDSSGGVLAAGLHQIYRSTDDGASWHTLGAAFSSEISALAVGADGRLVTAVEISDVPRSIRFSTDLGATWKQVQLSDSMTTTVNALAATPDGRLFAGTGGALFRSDDGGATWMKISVDTSNSGYLYYSAFATSADGSISVATHMGVYHSSDKGEQWQPIGNLVVRQSLFALVEAPSGTLLAGTFGSGIYAAEGNHWRLSSRGLPPAGARALAVAPDQTIYTVANNGRFFSSSDKGRSWSEPDNGLFLAPVIAVDAKGGIYAGSSPYPDGGVSHSTDGGATWTAGYKGIENEWVLSLLVGRHETLYAGVERGPNVYHYSETDGIFRSTDGGANWTTLGSGLKGLTINSIVELADGTLFVGDKNDPRVLRLAPGDTLWQEMTTGLPPATGHFVYSSVYPVIADKVENLYIGTYQGLYRSSNRGASWQRVGANVADTSITALALSPTGRIFAATALHDVYASDDNGESWQYLGDAPGVSGFDVLAVDSTGTVIAGNNIEGIYRGVASSSVPVTGNQNAAGLVAWPNPAALRTTVAFEMLSAGAFRLALYSSIGKEAAVVAEGEKGKGSEQVEIDLSGYAPGSYLLRLQTREGSREIGVVVVR